MGFLSVQQPMILIYLGRGESGIVRNYILPTWLLREASRPVSTIFGFGTMQRARITTTSGRDSGIRCCLMDHSEEDDRHVAHREAADGEQ